MASPKFMLQQFPMQDRYQVTDPDPVLTPALAIYPEAVATNIQTTLRLLDGNPDRWCPHIKTAKLSFTLRMLLDRGVRHFKCATTLELLEACRGGATDVLLAYPVMGANAARVREIGEQFPRVAISVLAEHQDQLRQWQGTNIGIFLDINPGMNRTGIEQNSRQRVIDLARAAKQSGLDFRGLHYYDGQFGAVAEPERTAAAHAGYDQLMALVRDVEQAGLPVAEVITAGTPAFPSSLSYPSFQSGSFIHRISPGTIVYNDATSLTQLPANYAYAPAALVVTRVVSHPHAGIVTCDAGHKAVSADAGIPTCVVVGHPELTPLSPSEEHLPMAVKEGAEPPRIGEILYLIPRHVCPTLNNFDAALIVQNGRINSVEKVSARGHEGPLRAEPVTTPALDSMVRSR